MSSDTRVANVSHTRAAKGWPRTGVQPEDGTTVHTSTTGTPFVAGTDSAARDIREAKWNARDGGTRS